MGKSKHISLKDLAERLKLSQATISRALRGDEAIKKATRKKIALAAASLGYQARKNIASPSPLPALYSKNKKTTIYDIAKMLALSATTVSRALNDHPGVGMQTKTIVMETAQNLGFEINNTARTLAGRRNFSEPGGKPVTISDVAKKVRLSNSTVSRALAGNPCIAEKTRQRIVDAAQQLSFTINSTAADLRNTQRKQVGLFVSSFNVRTCELLTALEKYAKPARIELTAVSAAQCNWQDPFKRALYQQMDGLICLPGVSIDPSIFFTDKTLSRKPLLVAGAFSANKLIPAVTIDPFRSSYDLAVGLLSKGCRSLCYVIVSDTEYPANEAIRGFKRAITDFKAKMAQQRVLKYKASEFLGVNLATLILKSLRKPDGVILVNCCLDEIGCHVLRESGIEVENVVCTTELEYGILELNSCLTSFSGYQVDDLAATSIDAINQLCAGLPFPPQLRTLHALPSNIIFSGNQKKA